MFRSIFNTLPFFQYIKIVKTRCKLVWSIINWIKTSYLKETHFKFTWRSSEDEFSDFESCIRKWSRSLLFRSDKNCIVYSDIYTLGLLSCLGYIGKESGNMLMFLMLLRTIRLKSIVLEKKRTLSFARQQLSKFDWVQSSERDIGSESDDKVCIGSYDRYSTLILIRSRCRCV